MQPLTREDIEKLIKEAKEAGKDTTELEQLLAQPEILHAQELPFGQTKKVGKRTIISTGPANKEDFK